MFDVVRLDPVKYGRFAISLYLEDVKAKMQDRPTPVKVDKASTKIGVGNLLHITKPRCCSNKGAVKNWFLRSK